MQAHSPIKGPLPHRKEASSLGHSPEIAKQTGVKWGGENGKKTQTTASFPSFMSILIFPKAKSTLVFPFTISSQNAVFYGNTDVIYYKLLKGTI